MAMLGTVWAAEKGQIEVASKAEVEVSVVNEQGEKEVKLMPASRVLPGTVVVYTVSYRNAGAEAADDIVITNPVPQHMIYLADSASGLETTITFSVDHGKSYRAPEELRVVNSDGSERPALAADYTHVRWTRELPLLASQEGSVSFRARLL
jgi:uncharacterized repeat protein (TIGR01451 family)